MYNEFTETSTAHAVLSYKIADEIEKPLRNPPVEYNKAKSVSKRGMSLHEQGLMSRAVIDASYIDGADISAPCQGI